jgi:hypothetical protein
VTTAASALQAWAKPGARRQYRRHCAFFHRLGVKIAEDLLLGDLMKQSAAFILLLASSIAWSIPANAQRENKSIGENGREARKAAKQQQKTVKRDAKKQRKAMKKYQKQQRKAAKRQQRRTK